MLQLERMKNSFKMIKHTYTVKASSKNNASFYALFYVYYFIRQRENWTGGFESGSIPFCEKS